MRTIPEIDRAIDANTRDLMARLHFNPDCSARQWQAAYDRCPDLRRRRDALYRERGLAQQERDQREHLEWQRRQRAERAAARKAVRQQLRAPLRPCPACGQFASLAA